MIRFALKCEKDHRFESWFQSGDAFDGLVLRDLVACPECGSTHVEKLLMAPKVRASRNSAAKSPEAQSMTNSGDPQVADAIAKLKDHVEKNSDYVGSGFAAEARAMHDGELPHRAIHGEAKPEEARKLIEDGIPALPLPFIPRQKTN